MLCRCLCLICRVCCGVWLLKVLVRLGVFGVMLMMWNIGIEELVFSVVLKVLSVLWFGCCCCRLLIVGICLL